MSYRAPPLHPPIVSDAVRVVAKPCPPAPTAVRQRNADKGFTVPTDSGALDADCPFLVPYARRRHQHVGKWAVTGNVAAWIEAIYDVVR